MWNVAHIAEAMRRYGPDYRFAAAPPAFDWATPVRNHDACIDRIHSPYEGQRSSPCVTRST